jgi:hypothetical protein
VANRLAVINTHRNRDAECSGVRPDNKQMTPLLAHTDVLHARLPWLDAGGIGWMRGNGVDCYKEGVS